MIEKKLKESDLPVSLALSKTLINLADYVINPYRGCSFGCIYCYTQHNKNILKHKEKWGEFVDIKKELPVVLEKELKNINPKRVLMGSTTEIFQHLELKYEITKKILAILKSYNIPFTILTKSYLIKNFTKLLNYNYENKIYFTFMFSDEKIRQCFEPNDSSLEKRREAISILISNNINVKIHIGPFIPFTDNIEKLFSLIPDGIKEVELELYNSKLGSLDRILSIVKDNISKETANKILNIYSSEENYSLYVQSIIKQINSINKNYNFSFNIIAPKFDSCYDNKEIHYE